MVLILVQQPLLVHTNSSSPQQKFLYETLVVVTVIEVGFVVVAPVASAGLDSLCSNVLSLLLNFLQTLVNLHSAGMLFSKTVKT